LWVLLILKVGFDLTVAMKMNGSDMPWMVPCSILIVLLSLVAFTLAKYVESA
jgi:hypothetical protein